MKPGERLIAWLLPHKIGEDEAMGFGRLHKYRMGRVTLVLEYDPDDADGEFVDIDRILAAQLGQGDGTQALRLICGMADLFGVKLSLSARALDDRPYSTNRLVAWYERHGFVAENAWRPDPDAEPTEEDAGHGGVSMFRAPRSEAERMCVGTNAVAEPLVE